MEPTPPTAPAPIVRRVPGVFSLASFVLCLVGVVLAPAIAELGRLFLSDRAALAPDLATGLALLAAVFWAAGFGALAAVAGRRLCFYEIVLATVVLGGLMGLAAGAFMPHLRGGATFVAAWEAQGTLVVVLGCILAALLSGTSAFVGGSLAFLATGSGRFDPSMSYELFVARSHLHLTGKRVLVLAGVGAVLVALAVLGGWNKAALYVFFFVLVAGALVFGPGVLLYSFVRDAEERHARRRAQPFYRRRLPATMLMTLISIGGVAIGVWALTVVLSVMSGFEADLKSKILGTNAHGVVLKYGQNDFTEYDDVLRKVKAVRGVVGASPFVMSEGMISSDQNMQGVVFHGVDPKTSQTVLDIARNMDEGKLEYLTHPEEIPLPTAPKADATLEEKVEELDESIEGKPKKKPAPKKEVAAAPAKPAEVLPGIVIGRELARLLRVYVGDVVNVVSPFGDIGPTGPMPKSRPFRVAGVFYSGMYEYDSKYAYLGLASAQKFFDTNGSVTGVAVKVNDVDAAKPIMRKVLSELEGYPYRVRDWADLNRNLFSALMMEKVVMAFILGFIVLVASFIIVATLVMLVLEKTREIAVLKSMGSDHPSVMKIFVAEGLIIGAIGTVFGLIIGYGSCLLVEKVGIPLDPEVYYISNLPVLVEPAQFAFVALAAMVLSYLATIYPATKASRLHPVEGLRSE